jgi:hypothetical protein
MAGRDPRNVETEKGLNYRVVSLCPYPCQCKAEVMHQEELEFTLSFRERAGVRVHSGRESYRGHRQRHGRRFNLYPEDDFTLTLSLSQRERDEVFVLKSRSVI